jgi:hypothetical protein
MNNKQAINEHDKTKLMIDIIRGGYKKLLSEEAPASPASPANQTAPSATPTTPDASMNNVGTDNQAVNQQNQDAQNQAVENDADTKSYERGTPEYDEEYKKLADIVDPSVNIDYLKVNPKTRKAEISGTIINGKATFTMDMMSDEVQLDTSLIALNDTNSEIMHKLQGYFKNWKEEMARSISQGDFNQN